MHLVRYLTRATMGYSQTLPANGGGVSTPPSCQTIGQTVDPKTVFDSPRLELPECVAKFYMSVTDDVTGRVKGLIFTISLAAFAGQSCRSKLK